ncbi:unnamed protein product [Rotaria magnacalcarata]|uniref:Uncharacterized protein n=2 Tax=Rotaria magnacalcarata TaxID=392030 RepID=A0A816TXN4_9BILA|nr:unnamed protein product [Rotaria magnacalcarata]
MLTMSTVDIETDHDDDDDNDSFFYYLMLIMPLLALGAYIYDAYSFLVINSTTAGILSSMLFIFYFLHYSVTIKSKLATTVYQVLIWLMVTTGDVLYAYYNLRENHRVHLIRYIGFIIIDFLFIFTVWICKMMALYKTHENYGWCLRQIFHPRFHINPHVRLHIKVHQRQFFSVVSRLETILATLIPIFFSEKIVRTTSTNISFVILFDFFYQSYHKLCSVWIKLCLYMLVSIVTASVATEWLYYVTLTPLYLQISGILEFFASSFCFSFIIMQFFPFHFHVKYRQT